ncbi:MAG: histidine phosphatase family protein [Gammaproteobacteria bacterium]|jgi:phosphohistidine phosphatase|nr:hypothetical protein [Gammaproteobacteria bacterium]MDP6098394.1 histidine phosphatase family protein [Gammaproteobacteria bacterium]MDP7455468.1 histidine phosphatase family protein [Gammaproteobacteria bacterium]|tara:strand:+ start:3423 stop:3923 length:501 start_codon:yes stop_codon:yes gene_type:complete
MKTLFILRHAKSSWDDPGLRDFERPLSDRGLLDAPVMGCRFLGREKSTDCIISSPAVRAKSTAKLFAEAIGFPAADLASNPELYFAGAPMFLKATSLLDESFDSAILVGHNPAITEFVNSMAGTDIENVPTCGLVELSLPIENWSEVELDSATLVDFDYPKNVTDT